MSVLAKLGKTLAATALVATVATAAIAKPVNIRVQSVISAKADEVTMLKNFAADVKALTAGDEVTIEVLPAGAVVGAKEVLDAVDKGLVEGGFAWTHYWSGKHPAAALFGSPPAGGGIGMDNLAWLSWFQFGGGKELYDQLWTEMGMNVKGFMLQPVGPEALGLVQRADQHQWPTSASTVSVHLLAFLARHIKTLVLPQLLWVVVTFYQRLKKAQSMRLNGAARSLTPCLVSRKCSSTTTFRVFTRLL